MVTSPEDWHRSALCKKDDFPSFWLSSEIDKVRYAQAVCQKCTVRVECFLSAIYERDEFIGVNGGVSEIEFLIRTWEEVEDAEQSNWRGSDFLIQELLREIA